MKYSTLFGKTNKTAKEYDSINATLLQKGGFTEQTMAGVYTYLHLGLRVLNKIERVIREEMDTIATEVLMPSFSPKELWERTGRIETIDVLFKASGANKASQEKNNVEYILNSTHEEVLMPMAVQFNRSYKDFPFAVYQIQTKFRNEPRAKSGLLRGREFRMKDAYSFHTSVEDFRNYYEKSKEVYNRIFERLGIGSDTYIVLASGGAFTTDFSHEFQTRCDSGEDHIFYVPSKDVAYNREIAPSKAPKFDQGGEKPAELKEVVKKGVIGVEDLAAFLDISVERTTKTMLYQTEEEELIAAAVRGDYEINEEKLLKVVGCQSLQLAPADVITKVTGAEVGYAGLVNLPDSVRLFIDDSVGGRVNFECGGNKTGSHIINVNFGRDIPEPEQFYDFKLAKEGDIFPETGEVYEVFRASEVGNIFPLHTKYSDAFDYRYIDAQGKEQQVIMGCYGIGTSRVMGLIAETYHDEKGLIWPKAIAPYQVHLVGLDLKKEEIKKRAYDVYETLQQKGIEVLFDDREDVSAGQKFSDADIIGIPHRVVVSKRTEDNVEWKKRTEEKAIIVDVNEVIQTVKSL